MAMSVKKPVPISDHFPNWVSPRKKVVSIWVSPRKKVVSRFGLGFISISIVLFFNFCFGNPISNELFFQGFKISNNSSRIAWSFSFSRNSFLNSTYSSSTIAVFAENGTQVEQSPNLDNNLNFFAFDEKGNTHSRNFTGDLKIGSFSGIFAKVLDFKETHLIKHKDDVKNGTFTAHGVNPNEGKVAIAQKVGSGRVKSVGVYRNLNWENNRDGNVDGSSLKECDIYDGRWVRDDTKPYYPPGSCPYVDGVFNCDRYKRPDNEFVKWRWQPYGCEIPSLNATNFLERLRGKEMVFVGDSLNRNMWESLVCILRHSLENKDRVYEISGRTKFQSRGYYAFRFEDYNCTVGFVKSSFLVKESSFKGKNGPFRTLRLDLMDSTTSYYRDADVLIFNTAHWWSHTKTSRGVNYYQEGSHVYPRLDVLDAYTKALSTWATWIDNNIDSRRTQVIFRGYSVTHYSGGQWNSGGQCHNVTEPIFNTSYLTRYPPKMQVFDKLLRVMKTRVTYLNISRLTDYRKDGHPSIYRTWRKSQKRRNGAQPLQDCSHWCLPGVPDTWNELLYASLLKVERES